MCFYPFLIFFYALLPSKVFVFLMSFFFCIKRFVKFNVFEVILSFVFDLFESLGVSFLRFFVNYKPFLSYFGVWFPYGFPTSDTGLASQHSRAAHACRPGPRSCPSTRAAGCRPPPSTPATASRSTSCSRCRSCWPSPQPGQGSPHGPATECGGGRGLWGRGAVGGGSRQSDSPVVGSCGGIGLLFPRVVVAFT